MADRYGHPRQSIFGRRHASAAASVSYSTSQHPQHQQPQHPQQPHRHAGPSSSTAGQAQVSGVPVRRNLFQSQLTRRLPPGKNGGAGLGLGGLDGADDGDGDTVVVEEDGDGDGGIVVRDIHGEPELDEPPNLVVDDPDEIVLDLRQENESAPSAPSVALRRV